MSKETPYVCTLSKELQELAKTELNEDPETRQQEIQKLREKVIANKALKCPRDEAFLLRFLRTRKFDQARAYDLLINYYTVRANNSQILKALTPSNSKDVIESGLTAFLPSSDKLGRRILYFRFGKWNPDELEMMRLLRLNVMSLEQLIKDDETQVRGIVAIANAIDVGMSHLKSFDLNYIRTMTNVMQDAFPMRFKGMHFINEPSIFGYMYTLIKPFMKQKMIDRQTFHGSSLESLHTFFDPSSLPNELGGSLGDGDDLAKAWAQELHANEKYFEGMNAYKIDLESDIFKGSKLSDQVSAPSITGTFKKLEI